MLPAERGEMGEQPVRNGFGLTQDGDGVLLVLSCRCRSRGVGSVPAASLGTALDRGGMITAASGWRLMTAL